MSVGNQHSYMSLGNQHSYMSLGNKHSYNMSLAIRYNISNNFLKSLSQAFIKHRLMKYTNIKYVIYFPTFKIKNCDYHKNTLKF